MATLTSIPGELAPGEAYARYLSDARELSTEDIRVCRANLAICLFNVRASVSAIAPHRARIAKELPHLDIDALLDLSSLAVAVLFASQNAMPIAPRRDINTKLRAVRKLRRSMLLGAEMLASLGMIPSERVRAIRSGKGPLDTARDGIAIEALYRDSADAVHGKHPFTQAMFDQLVRDSLWLLDHLKPRGARTLRRAKEPNDRDRLWSLLVLRFRDLRRVGFYLFGEAIDQHVPPLGARRNLGQTSESAYEAS